MNVVLRVHASRLHVKFNQLGLRIITNSRTKFLTDSELHSDD